jgi:hypothetical protein
MMSGASSSRRSGRKAWPGSHQAGRSGLSSSGAAVVHPVTVNSRQYGSEWDSWLYMYSSMRCGLRGSRLAHSLPPCACARCYTA